MKHTYQAKVTLEDTEHGHNIKIRVQKPSQLDVVANGRKGGLARAKKLSPEQLSEIGKKGAEAKKNL